MKQLIIIFFLFSFSLTKAQRYTDFGLIGGGTYYMGEINPKRHFYKLSPAFGALFRININKRYAVRICGIYAGLRGSDSDFPDRNVPLRSPQSFNKQILDFNSQLEFNFLPYITGEEKWLYSTYVSAGLGCGISTGSSPFLTIPFGVGFKVNLTKRLSSGCEWSFRKTFRDNIDNVENQLGNTLLNNNDWYSFIGVFITYKFFKFAADCPAYN
ncbi:MAG: hypothetical protein JXB24_02175 [Bacteroidales bacterium]|nr:hypothetical protein [Bacteroidales bacterium]